MIAREPCEYCGGNLVKMDGDVYCCEDCGRQVSAQFIDE